MMDSSKRRALFRLMVEERKGLLMPGAFNALSARVATDAGFKSLYLSGAGVTNMYLGMPDLSFIGLSDMADHTSRVRDAVSLPLLVDADTGYGNAVNVAFAVRTLERAGADAIQLEDQVNPKKCGHFNGKDVIGTDEMVGKIRAAVDARTDPNLLIVARTDACAIHGYQAAIDRAHAFAEAGADVLFVEAVESLEEVEAMPSLLPRPLLMNIVIGGKTPALPQARLAELGFGIVLYANAGLQGAVLGMQKAFATLGATGMLEENPELVVPFAERQRLVDKARYDAMEKRYAAP
ncbi:isocitrate lyase/PEP mutase family protein [Herbaspirillum chlorophenolicum]|uniref:isocitrate lyase/PEP mutase family protein n=1 Tax=Herbaspirillum chlorophenolicum TaxID=211589 RepID=UPI00067BE314|nr:oxaloacetate decarboxylase [Herbaspirillum chlorophenolicum]